MYAEVNRAARLCSDKYWPLPADVRGRIDGELLDSGWRPDGGAYVLPARNSAEELRVALELDDLPAFSWQGTAALAGLTALAAARIPLRAAIRLYLADPQGPEEELLVLAPACGRVEMGVEQGLLVVFTPFGADGLVRIPCWSRLSRAREVLGNAGFHPQVALWAGHRYTGLGFVAPGRPDGGREELARAAQAYAGLLYGLAGYGVMAFDFDLDL